ncbi:uncharacterized protein LOC126734670 [Anthonomus grandis grandis]|uniref:uncharacterized protein LOC126734670 n=1 Tax=Anthonomus grandis grandis TaxID=2921223 RepID=UPI002165105D|nr:uncharacterized protein LOC126734670 [Anthonomus grandis grandis]
MERNQFLHRQALSGQSRVIIANVYRVCDEEALANAFKLPLKRKIDRVALYTGVSKDRVSQIHKEAMKRQAEHPDQMLSSPPNKKSRICLLRDFDDFSIITRTINNFYLELKMVPTVNKLLIKLREIMNFPYSRETLRKLLKANGFYFRKCQNKRKILVERPAILHWRYKYIRAIRKYREEGRNIVYLDETWVDNDLTFGKCWQSNEVFGVVSNIRANGRLVIVHAGSQSGFIHNAGLVFKAGQASGDYHGQMNKANFTKWLEEKLLPNIPQNSVIILDNAPYHSVQENKVPTKSSIKKDMTEWLTKNGIQHDPAARKWELFEIIQRNKPPSDEKNYVVDRIIRTHGHVALRTPPYMCELNPIELVWAQLKNYIRSHNTTGDLAMKNLAQLVQDGIESLTPLHWVNCCKHVMEIENKFWETDQIMEEVEQLIITNAGDTIFDS